MTVWLDGASLLSQIFFVFFRDKKSWVVALKLWQSVYNNAVDFARQKLLEKKKKTGAWQPGVKSRILNQHQHFNPWISHPSSFTEDYLRR